MFPILLGKNNDLEKRVKTLEDSGGGGSVDILEATFNGENVCNKTVKQIMDAYPLCIFKITDLNGDHTLSCVKISISEDDGIALILGNGYRTLFADTINDYPVIGR